MLARITIIGRPNVGKSSFFNMYTGHKIAIIANNPGTTRDISEYEYIDKEQNFRYILSDSGGLDVGSKNDAIAIDIIKRTKEAIIESDLLMFLVEYDRITQGDEDILKILREQGVGNVILIANKADNEIKIMESYSHAGFGNFDAFFPVSVVHNNGIQEIKKYVIQFLRQKGFHSCQEEADDSFVKIALVGRPNVGKSSILNAILGKQRVIVEDRAGTTRDSIDTKFCYTNQNFILIDTAGIRRLSKVGVRNIEDWSLIRTNRSIMRSDIVGVVIDGFAGLVHQDLSIISKVLEENKGLIIIVNKWDRVLAKPNIDKGIMMNKYIDYLKSKLSFLPWTSVIFTSAIEQKRVNEILKSAFEIKHERCKRVKTGIFNNFIEQIVYKHSPTGNKKSHSPKIYYGSQVAINPPKFLISVNNPNHFHFSYKRYLENKIRDNFGFYGTPIIIQFKGRGKCKDIVK